MLTYMLRVLPLAWLPLMPSQMSHPLHRWEPARRSFMTQATLMGPSRHGSLAWSMSTQLHGWWPWRHLHRWAAGLDLWRNLSDVGRHFWFRFN
jgi:hypothetical protein